MKAKFILVFFLVISIIFMPDIVLAHPGRTDSNGCHYCRTNCAKWGLSNNEYHCHGGNTSSNVNAQNNEIYEQPKSDDNTLKSVSVDGNNIEISDNMSYKTFNYSVEILVETNDSKATYEISKKILFVGNNNITIKVIAENGAIKKYNLVVIREKLSNNTNIKVTVDNENVNFINGKASIDVSSNTDKLNYDYTLEDEKAKVEVTEIDKLKFGENIMKFKVTAEDGTEKIYELTINKSSKIEEIIETILGLWLMGGIGCAIYFIVKNKKNNTKK